MEAFAWPAATLIVGIVALFVFRKPFERFLDRANKIGAKGIEASGIRNELSKPEVSPRSLPAGSHMPDVYANRDRYNELRPQLFRTARKVCLHSIYADVPHGLGPLIAEALEQQKTVEILIADPDNRHVRGDDQLQLAVMGLGSQPNILRDIKLLRDLERQRRDQGWLGRLEVKTYMHQPMWCIYMFDDKELFAAPYLYRVEGGDTICIHARKHGYEKGAFDQFKRHYGQLWRDSEPLRLY